MSLWFFKPHYVVKFMSLRGINRAENDTRTLSNSIHWTRKFLEEWKRVDFRPAVYIVSSIGLSVHELRLEKLSGFVERWKMCRRPTHTGFVRLTYLVVINHVLWASLGNPPHIHRWYESIVCFYIWLAHHIGNWLYFKLLLSVGCEYTCCGTLK